MKTTKTAVLMAAAVSALSACSVGMAMSGKQNPNLGAVQVGATRGQVELHLGKAVQTTTLDSGQRADVYGYQIGNEPSAGRAVAHGVMDVLTFGVWEIVGTPIEGFQGEDHQITVTYDSTDRVAAIQ